MKFKKKLKILKNQIQKQKKILMKFKKNIKILKNQIQK